MNEPESCDPEPVDPSTPISATVTWQDLDTFVPQTLSTTWTLGELMSLAGGDAALAKGMAVYADAEALKANDPADAWAPLESAEQLAPADPDLAEIRSVLESM